MRAPAFALQRHVAWQFPALLFPFPPCGGLANELQRRRSTWMQAGCQCPWWRHCTQCYHVSSELGFVVAPAGVRLASLREQMWKLQCFEDVLLSHWGGHGSLKEFKMKCCAICWTGEHHRPGEDVGLQSSALSRKPCWLSKQRAKGRGLPTQLLPSTPSCTHHNQILHQLSSCISLLFCSLPNIQAQCTELVLGNWRYWYYQVGSSAVSSPCLGDMFLLHLERSQIHWESKCSFTLLTITAVSGC